MYFYVVHLYHTITIRGRNPCYNGRCISTKGLSSFIKNLERRNPCYNGRCISTRMAGQSLAENNVAILVIMEDVFLHDYVKLKTSERKKSRNPCYNGRCISTT